MALKDSIKSASTNVAFSAAFKYLEKDPVKNFPKLMKWADTFTKGNDWNKAVKRFSDWYDQDTWQGVLIKRVLNDLDTNYLKNFILNFFLNAGVKGMPIAKAKGKELGVNVPWAILMDPTSACNLKCLGCWAAEYGKHYNLTYEKMDEIITQGKELGIYFYIYSGGEPLVRKKDLIRLAEKHSDCAFGAFTNGTLIDDDFVQDLLRVANFTFMISVEGTKEETDFRRGEGTYDAVMAAMKRLKDARIPFGFSGAYTSKNYKTIVSDEWLDMLIDAGCLFGWLFTYMPIGSGADLSLCVNPEQRAYMYTRVREMREYKPIMMLDFWNDGEYVGGCIAGGRRYFHINSNGDCEPCAFIHYATHNINECTLEEALGSPLFKKYQEGQPFSDNLLRPCPLLDNPQALRDIVNESGAKPTQDLDLEGVDTLTAKTDLIAERWQTKADELWACGHYPHNAVINHAMDKTLDNTGDSCGHCGRIKTDRETEKPAHLG